MTRASQRWKILCSLLLAVLWLASPAEVGAWPARPTGPVLRRAQLTVRDRFWDHFQDHEKAGRLAEAVAVLEKCLALERGLFGVLSDDVVGSLQWLARVQEKRDDLAAARKTLVEVAALQARRFGNEDWQAADAHFALVDLRVRARLNPTQRAEYWLKIQEAQDLSQRAAALYRQGKYTEAAQLYRQSLTVRKKLYPPPHYPRGHPDLATSLNNMGFMLYYVGEYTAAEPYYHDALAMRHKLYPKERYPHGHPDLANSLNNLGFLLQSRGEYGAAEPFYRDALAMRRQLYPADRYPQGHPDLAESSNNMGLLLQSRGEYGAAEPFYRDALAMQRQLYPADHYPQGHPDLARSLNNLGFLLHARGEYKAAQPYYDDALAMCQKLYPADHYPQGHPDLARSLNNLGGLLHARGEYGAAQPYYRDALAMYQKLYPPDRYPQGHPHFAGTLNNLGGLLQARGEYGAAEPYYRDALAMYQGLLDTFAQAAAETRMLNYQTALPASRDFYLTVTARLTGADPGHNYPQLWRGKGALLNVLESRQRLLHRADEVTRRQLSELLRVRQQLAEAVLAPLDLKDKDRPQRLQKLSDHKEALETQLAAKVPALAQELERRRVPYTDLVDHLPKRSAFIDLFRYRQWNAKERKWENSQYVAFVLRPSQPLRRVELGPATLIEDALAHWRRDITGGRTSVYGEQLRRAVWDKLALPADTAVAYVCPDGALSALPWAALPGSKSGRVLLEDCAVALVPSGIYLYQHMAHPAQYPSGALLAVGGVQYDQEPAAVAQSAGAGTTRSADLRGRSGPWGFLAGTERERTRVADLARALSKPAAVLERHGAGASTGQLLIDLPRARWAHLATHGFFAAPDTKEREQFYQRDDFAFGVGLERRGFAVRHPLTQTGLVLAGANEPQTPGRGILTAEAIAGLNLDGLELAVLSACETGLGEAATGEGVFGLQRAFHLAGTRNVIASLWKVDDEATQFLMEAFYRNLWDQDRKLSKLQALVEAQRKMLRDDKLAAALAARPKRGPAPGGQPYDAAKALAGRQKGDVLPPFFWAAFVLSGDGR